MDLGFIILRHVNGIETNQYWQHCYDCIRKHYPENKILIIDDCSKYEYITNKELYNTTIINSEFEKRGEILPYYYYLKNKLFDTAVIIHDSVFINHHIDFKVENYRSLWRFEHWYDCAEGETKILSVFDDQSLIDFYYNKSQWKGCFGSMTIITHDFLTFVNSKHDISLLLNVILNRGDRSMLERVIGCLFQKYHKTESMFGDIFQYMQWGTKFSEKDNFNNLPIIKVWTGR